MPDSPHYRNLINGELRAPASGRYFPAENPATGEVFAQIPASDATDVNAAVEAAAAAFPAWSSMIPAERGFYMRAVGDQFLAHGEELAELESRDNGFPLETIRVWLGIGMQFLWHRGAHLALDAVTGRTVPLENRMLGMTRREPYGVVACIIPWNAPSSIMSSKASVAMSGGNTVVIKSPEQASASILRFAELVADVLPPGVLNIVSGDGPETGAALVGHRKVRKVTMTGSPGTARAIQRTAADALTSSVFELGGKNPNIVFDDADLDAATKGVASGGMYIANAGQGCGCGSRILLQRGIFDEMIDRIKADVAQIKLGDPLTAGTTMGPIISAEQYERVLKYIEIGKSEAELVFGGRHGPQLVPPELAGGRWVEPTLFTTTDNSLTICQDEIFGPVAVAIPFDTEEEAIAIANDTRYGLVSGVWTQDLERAHRMVQDIQAGNVWVNTYFQTRMELPFGGIKESGYGHDDVMDFTFEKSAVIAPKAIPPVTDRITAEPELPPMPSPRSAECPMAPPAVYTQWRDAPGLCRAMNTFFGEPSWVISRYNDIRDAMTDPRFSAKTIPDALMLRDENDEPAVVFQRSDDPVHHRLRKLMTGDFTVRRAREMTPEIQRLVDGYLDDMIAAGPPCDLVAALALPLPSVVICLLLGVPYEDHDLFEECSVAGLDVTISEEQRIAAVGQMFTYLTGLLERKKAEPADDVLSRLNELVATGDMSMVSAVMTGYSLLQAGHETTAAMIALGTLVLLKHPDVLVRLRDSQDPRVGERIVDELLRYLTIVHSGIVDRIALEDIELGGQLIHKGERVLMNLTAGNYDRAFVDNPQTFDPERGARGHLAFGWGVHQCLGQTLARVELQIALTTLVRRLPDLRLAVPEDDLVFMNEQAVWRLDALPVTW